MQWIKASSSIVHVMYTEDPNMDMSGFIGSWLLCSSSKPGDQYRKRNFWPIHVYLHCIQGGSNVAFNKEVYVSIYSWILGILEFLASIGLKINGS